MINYHIHTNLSIDCSETAEDMVISAINAGITNIAITDHFDLTADSTKSYNLINTINQFKILKAKFANKIDISCGVEMGQPADDNKMAIEILKSREIDFVLASMHNFRNEQDFYFINYNTVNVDYLLDRYFDEILKMCEQYSFDSLAHLDYPKRYIIRDNASFDLTKHSFKINKILKTIINKNIALEINTSGILKEMKVPMPDIDIIKSYYKLGGRLVTIGSDAHKITDIASGLLEGEKILKEIGFKEICIYKNRKPIKIPL